MIIIVLEINNLINSEHKMLRDFGWLLYGRQNQDGGLTKEELNELLQIVTVENMENEYQTAYNEGFNDGVSE
ncbi:hypothetical protein [Bacillus sp. T33-2]|uniref:hypothetical protein n=1 Tax=Bacillus sp. T33-2 TaxID=2054168 RepID=UPI001C6105DA|nr:hypothetical protein [Bacillus sp. T33-2]